jgi:hypothetical protein
MVEKQAMYSSRIRHAQKYAVLFVRIPRGLR